MKPEDRDNIRKELTEFQDFINTKIAYLEEKFDCHAIIHHPTGEKIKYMVTLADRSALREIHQKAKQ